MVSLLYTLMAFVAAGVLPIEQVAGKSLAPWRPKYSTPVYIFFMVGGAIVARVTSLNALFAWITPPLAQACTDGWIPKFLGKENQKFHTNHWILTIIYLLTASIIIFDWQMDTIANVGYFLAIELSKAEIIGLFIYMGAALLYPYLMLKIKKDGIQIETSYEEA